MVSDHFLKECLLLDYQRFCKINEILKDPSNLSLVDIDKIMNESFRMIHIMKGTLGFLKLKKETQILHALETQYINLIRSNPQKDDVYILNVQIEKFLSKVMEYYLFEQIAMQTTISLEELFLTIQSDFKTLIENKKIQIIPIYSKDRLEKEIANDVYKIVYQIIKNAISHGYTGKDMVIRLNGSCTNQYIKLKISNDGVPINFDKLIKKAQKEENVNAHLGNVLFLNNVSSTAQRDEISGSGVGLNCVYEMIKKHNGNIQIISQAEDTLFYILLPLG